MNFYNDIDPFACSWTSELIKHGLIPDGIVACKSIEDIQPHEIQTFSQCHFFNGISGWAEALRLADWPADRPVWCASLPCQSFSCAGKGEGFDDERGQLWSPFLGLVRQLHPLTILGEQVPAAIGHGWLDRVFSDLEKEGYNCGAVVLGAHSVGAPHIRNRLYWVAHAESGGFGNQRDSEGGRGKSFGSGQSNGLADAARRRQRTDGSASGSPGHLEFSEQAEWLGSPNLERSQGHSGNGNDRNEPGRVETQPTGSTAETGSASGVGDASSFRCNQQGRTENTQIQRQCSERNPQQSGSEYGGELSRRIKGLGSEINFWSDALWHPCRDGKLRRIPVEPEIFPLAPRLPGRMGLLRGAGNSICPETAALFIRAFLETKK